MDNKQCSHPRIPPHTHPCLKSLKAGPLPSGQSIRSLIKLYLHGCLSLSVYSASNLLVLFNDSILRKGLRCAFPVVSNQ